MRGQGNIIIATIFFSILLLAIIPLILNIYHSSLAKTPIYENPMYRAAELTMKVTSREIIAFFNASNSILEVVNIGGSDIEVEKVVVYISCNNQNHYLNMDRVAKLVSGQRTSLDLKISESLCENLEVKTLYIITVEGAVISSTVITIEELSNIPYTSNISIPIVVPYATRVIPISVGITDNIWSISLLEQKGFTIETLDRMDNPTKVLPYPRLAIDKGMKGGTTTSYIWRLNRVENNINVNINDQAIRSLWIGYDPRNKSRYNIIITADRISMTLGSSTQGCSTASKVKIYGFESLYAQGIIRLRQGSTINWITKPDPDVAKYTFLTTSSITTQLMLLGSADRVEIYCRGTGDESSYNPYTIFMNTDGSQGYAGILYTAIDRTWGFYNSRNENDNQLLDYSVAPLALVYRGFAISNNNYSSVVIAINYRFHDNEGSDAQGTSIDRPIMFVGLVDEGGTIYSYRSYTFRELTRYEDTYPPTAQAQSSLIFIPLPPRNISEKLFYVFIAFQDPYHYNGNLDDLDFTLYIESLAIIPFR